MHEHELVPNALVKGSVLIICTSANKIGDQETGAWLSEIAEPYYALKHAGYDVTLASISGGAVPLDPASIQMAEQVPEAKKFQSDDEAQQLLKQTVPLSAVHDPATYDAIFLPGGHGAMVDEPDNPHLAEILSKAWSDGKIVAAVCHGPSGLLGAKVAPGSQDALVKGKTVSCFTDAEEKAVGKDKVIPYSLEQRMRELGANLDNKEPNASHAVRDGKLITGQNVVSAGKVGQLLVQALAEDAPERAKRAAANAHLVIGASAVAAS